MLPADDAKPSGGTRRRPHVTPTYGQGARRTAAVAIGVFLVAVTSALLPACSEAPAKDRPSNLILVTIDTLRADHLGIYGYERDTSPSLDALAREGTWFEEVYSESATTGAAHASIFTSLPPAEHGVLANRQPFPSDKASLMSALKARGYFTAGFASSIVVGRQSGLQDHFEHFDDDFTDLEPTRPTRAERPAPKTIDAALRTLDERPKDRPFFVWIHLIDPHGPYQAPEQPDRFVGDPFYGKLGKTLLLGASDWQRERIPRYQVIDGRTDADFYVARYDAEIRYADTALGGLFQELQRRGLLDDTLIAVTADHGETLAESGHQRYFSHGAMVYRETVHVPLIVREPHGQHRLAHGAIPGPVSSLDIAPTLLALLDAPIPGGFRGRNLVREKPDPKLPLFSFGAYGSKMLERDIGTQFCVRRDGWTFIANLPDGSEELYDRRNDPGEQNNLIASEPAPAALAELRSEVAQPLEIGRAHV